MLETLKLHQGPGLNGLYLSAAPLARNVDQDSDTIIYTLPGDYTVSVHGYPQNGNKSRDFPLNPTTCKLLDLLVCELGDSKSRQVELPLEKFLLTTGYTVTEVDKNFVRPKLKKSIALLGALSADWTECNGQYLHHEVKFFDEITYQYGRVCARFSEDMAAYLRGCPSMDLPLPLLAVRGKSPHCYPLGRRCLVHDAANGGGQQAIRVRSLLAVCPCIPRPDSKESWPPSILERKVIEPFTAAMARLADGGILTWKFREPLCRNDYEGFSDSMVEFQVQAEGAAPVSPMPADCSDTKREYGPFDYKAFLAIR